MLKEQKSMVKKERGYLIVAILFFSVIIAAISFLSYSFYAQLGTVKEDYNAKVNNLHAVIEENAKNLTAHIALLENLVENAEKENKQKISTLSKLVSDIESKTNIQLGELKKELSNINVESVDFSSIVDEVLESTVSIVTDRGQGSGAIISDDGFVVTNLHVISGASLIRVLTYSGKTYNAKAIGYNGAADIAVLKIEGSFQKLPFGDSDEVKVGQKVIALGNPRGLDFSVTEGIVSALRIGSNSIKLIQTDVPLNPGNSGGPLVNKAGQIIGINNFKVGGSESLGFAINSNTVEDVVDDIIVQYEKQQP